MWSVLNVVNFLMCSMWSMGLNAINFNLSGKATKAKSGIPFLAFFIHWTSLETFNSNLEGAPLKCRAKFRVHPQNYVLQNRFRFYFLSRAQRLSDPE